MKSKSGLDDLLARLDSRSDDAVAMRTFQGRALSKSDTNLHLAVRTGIVAVPLANVVKVMPIRGTKDMVRIVVRNPEEVRSLLRVTPQAAAGDGTAVGLRRGEFIGKGFVGVATCNFYDTPTVTGEEGDDTSDDEDSDCEADDS